MEKGTQLINFLNNKTQIENPTDFKIIRSNASENVECSVARLINFFYRANAVCKIQYNERSSGKLYYNWVIQLHEGNPISWLLPYNKDIVRYIQYDLGWEHVQGVEIVTI